MTVLLTGTDVNGQPVRLTTTTAADGTFSFTGLLAGTYTLTETQPAGYSAGKNEAGSLGGVVSTSAIGTISLPEGQNGVSYNFAELRTSSISGIVYYDYDHNGTYGANDFGIANVPVTLTGTNDLGQSVSLSTTTDVNGNYSFGGLQPGTYTIKESAPKVFITGPTNPCTTGGTPGVRTLSNVTLTPGVSSTSNNFAQWQRPGCNLADLAFHVGRSFARDTELYDANPAQFQARYPKLAAFIAADEVPRGIGTYPNAAYSYRLVPTLGTKVVPYEPWVGRVKVKNGRILPAAKPSAAPLHVSSTSHPVGPMNRPHSRRAH